jgi:hypothetical protein
MMNRTRIAILSALTATFFSVGCTSQASDEAADEAAHTGSPTLVDCSEGGEGFVQVSGPLPLVQGRSQVYSSLDPQLAFDMTFASNRRGSITFVGKTFEPKLSNRAPVTIQVEVDGIDFTQHPSGRLSSFNTAASVRVITPKGTTTFRQNCIVAPLLKSVVR